MSRIYGITLVAILAGTTCAMAQPWIEPCLFFDFDEDGIADDFVVDSIKLELLEPTQLYVGVRLVPFPDYCLPDVPFLTAVEYQIAYEGDYAPACSVYAEPGAPIWTFVHGDPLHGGWFQHGTCRAVCPEFVALLFVTGTGSRQSFHFIPTSPPYEFPGLLMAYDCEPAQHPMSAYNSAVCSSSPELVTATPWGAIKAMLR